MAKAIRTKNDEQREVVKRFRALAYRHSPWTVWADFVTIVACAISSAVDTTHREHREKLYADIAKKYTPEELESFAVMFAEVVCGLEENPNQDFLGELFMALELYNSHKGQFFTPYNLCQLMVKLTSGDDLREKIERNGWISVGDCCCGAGATLIAFANECLRQKVNHHTSVLFVAQDIDFTVAMMCYIQLSLLGCAGYVIVGNSLTEPPPGCGDRGLFPPPGEHVWTTPMFFLDEWDFRRTVAIFKAMMVPTAATGTKEAADEPATHAPPPGEPEGGPEPRYDIELNTDKRGQFTLF